MSGDARRAAAFLDRDGTIVEDVHYLARPEQLRLIPDAVTALRRLHDAHVPVVVVTNQSGIARGMLSADDYAAIERRLDAMLAAEGVHVAATYHCPHHPEFSGPCACRKPGVLLYERAAAELSLDPARSLFVGDRWRDVAPALRLGGTGVLVPGPNTPPDEEERARRTGTVAPSLDDAVRAWLRLPA